ncbi:MAG TPA: hypothetical protein G4O19_03495 [Dehalococcoidia bacterium]|nr:hypothetical protein [Dehalococcoidia bacterium]
MVMWRIKSCPRCGGDIYVDIEGDILFDHCLQCSYMSPSKDAPCPRCGSGLHIDPDKWENYLYCDICGYSTRLHKVAK